MSPAERVARIKRLESVDFGHVPTKELEVAWIDATCLYEKWDRNALSDGRWDALTAHLWKFRGRLSPYFVRYVPMDCLKSSTGSGIDWSEGVPALSMEACKKIVETDLV